MTTKRQWPRITLEALVEANFVDLNELITGPLNDLSLGGVFVKTRTPWPIGARVVLQVSVVNSQVSFRARGEVVRQVSEEEARTRALVPGMGLRFTELSPRDRSSIVELIASVQARQVLNS